MERDRKRDSEKINLFADIKYINSAATSEARTQAGVKRSLWKFRFALSFKFVHAINRTDYPCCDFSIV